MSFKFEDAVKTRTLKRCGMNEMKLPKICMGVTDQRTSQISRLNMDEDGFDIVTSNLLRAQGNRWCMIRTV